MGRGCNLRHNAPTLKVAVTMSGQAVRGHLEGRLAGLVAFDARQDARLIVVILRMKELIAHDYFE